MARKGYPSLCDLSTPLNSSLDRCLSGSRSFLYDDSPSKAFYSTRIFRSRKRLKPSIRQGFFIPHSHRLKRVWDICITLLLTYSSIESLLYVCYHDHGFALNSADPYIWGFFVLDFIGNFVTDYRDENGEIVRRYALIAKKYLKTWLLLDLIALTPLLFFGLRLLQHYLQLLRLLKIHRFFNLIDEGWIFPLAISCCRSRNSTEIVNVKMWVHCGVTIVKQLLAIVGFTFLSASIYYWYATMVSGNHVFAESYVRNHPMDLVRPLETLYFAITTLSTIGYGDLTPYNTSDRLFVIFMILVGLGMFTIIIGQYNSLLSELNAWGRNDNQVDELSNWLIQCELTFKYIPGRLKQRVFDFYRHYWKTDRLGTIAAQWWKGEDFTRSPDPVFEKLPKHEREQVLNLLFGDLFGRYRRFLLKNGLRYDLALHLSPRMFLPKEILLRQGEHPKEVLLVTKGLVYCGRGFDTEFVSVLSYEKRLILGDTEILLRHSAIATYKAGDTHPVTSFAIPSKPFRAILRFKYPEARRNLLEMRRKHVVFVKKAFKMASPRMSILTETEMMTTVDEWHSARFKERYGKEQLQDMQEQLRELKEEKRRRKETYWRKRDLILQEIGKRLPGRKTEF